jgi:FeS assembly SUF system regulator
MIKISKLADYATIVLSCMISPLSELKSAAQLADKSKIPLPTVSKLLKILNEAGLVESIRGAHGGYQLTKRPENMNLVDIITAIDGSPVLTECGHGDDICSRDTVCNLKGNWQRVSWLVLDMLRKITLADMNQSPNKEWNLWGSDDGK